ncbi:Uncharacterized protein Fot_35153 [Forsythia ovata]|uniref:Uncharacterized protein n=1 Tax=Forsythia ovata TaxID=205694 RepID=A0ABD1SKQ1_9LAMI
MSLVIDGIRTNDTIFLYVNLVKGSTENFDGALVFCNFCHKNSSTSLQIFNLQKSALVVDPFRLKYSSVFAQNMEKKTKRKKGDLICSVLEDPTTYAINTLFSRSLEPPTVRNIPVCRAHVLSAKCVPPLAIDVNQCQRLLLVQQGGGNLRRGFSTVSTATATARVVAIVVDDMACLEGMIWAEK